MVLVLQVCTTKVAAVLVRNAKLKFNRVALLSSAPTILFYVAKARIASAVLSMLIAGVLAKEM